MIPRALQQEIGRILPPGQIRVEEPMSLHCSFRTGGPADALVSVRTEEEMTAVLSLLRREGEACYVVGRGTNLLIGDGGYRGVIVTMVPFSAADQGAEKDPPAGPQQADKDAQAPLLDEVRVEGAILTAGAGATMHAAAMAAADHGLSGLEFAAGIPGTVGGGLVMNAGAYGGEMRQVVRTVRLLLPESGKIRSFSGEEMEFGYRTSLLRHLPAAALRAEFSLTPGDPAQIRARIAELSAERRSKQPLEYPSAGSTFKRPEGHFAGKLIMDAGLRGCSVGGAQVSEKHCGFIINRGGASSAQIRRLIEEVQKRVLEETGVLLEREVIFLGEF